MKKIRLMADYQCFPLWGDSIDFVGDIDPRSLPISASLVDRLMEWAEKYDSTLNVNDPAASGFKTKEDEEKFIRSGNILLDDLRGELGGGYAITFKYVGGYMKLI